MANPSKKPEFRMEASESVSTGYARISKKASGSGAGLVVSAAVLASFADAFALGLMLYHGLTALFFAVPAAILAVDALFLILACFTNFRFRYAKVAVGLYVAVSAALSIVFTVLLATGSEQTMTYLGIGAFFVPHLLVWGALAWTSKLAETPRFSGRKWTSSAAILLLIAGVALSLTANLTSGALGQGVYQRGGEKEVVFGYLPDEGFGDGYAVVGVVEGKGDTIHIPATFHGKPVSSVDCAVFSAEGIKTVYLDDAAAKKLTNLGALASANADLEVVAYREAADAYAIQLFDAALNRNNAAAGEFLNALRPAVADDEFFVSFRYDFASLPADARPIPVYIGKKGGSFGREALGGYAERYEKRADLTWNYQNSGDRSRMLELTDGAGNALVGKKLYESVENVTVGFERVYKLDRDAGRGYGGAYDRTVYATRSELNDVLKVERVGCTLYWDARVAGAGTTKIGTEAELKTLLDGDAKDAETIELSANWAVVAPEPTALRTNAVNNAITYGDSIRLTAEAKTHPLGLTYCLYAPDKSPVGGFSEASEFTLRGLEPKRSGEYAVVCRATDRYDPSLYADSVISVVVTVGKKTLEFAWNEFSDPVYDGTDKAIRPTPATASVGGEPLYYEPSVASVKNAGTYRVSAILKDGSEEKYRVSDATGTKTYTVARRELTVEWEGDLVYDEETHQYFPVKKIYNGQTQYPNIVRLNGVAGGDEPPTATVSGGKKDAGTYTARAALPDTVINYALSEQSASIRFTIEKRAVTITWSASELTYNGSAQRPTASGVTGAVGGEDAAALADLAYFDVGDAETRGETNAGSGYTVTARFRESSNYTFAVEAKQVYAILPAALEVKAEDKTKTYDGAAFADFTAKFTGLKGSDTASEVLEPVFYGAATTAVTYAENGYEIEITGTEKAKFGNYTVTYQSGNLTIAKRAVTVKASGKTKIYDGKESTDFTAALGGAGLAAGDTREELGSVTFTGSAVGAKNASDAAYVITPKIDESDRGAKFGNYALSFENGALTIRRRAATVRAVGGEKVYDGAAFSGCSIAYGALAEGDGWSDVALFEVKGAGTTAVDASDDPYPVYLEITAGSEGAKRGNYTLDFVGGAVSIGRRALTVAAKAGKTKTYDGNVASFDASDYEAVGLAPTDTLAEVMEVAFGGAGASEKNAGEHAFTLSVRNAGAKYQNYAVTFTGAALTIEKRALTVTADDKTKVYDGKEFTDFTAALGGAGLAAGDSIGEVGAVTFGGAAYGAKNASDAAYVITAKIDESDRGAKFGNYALSFENGALTIRRRAAKLRAVGGEKVYDGEKYAVSVRTENLVDPLSALGTVLYEGADAIDAGTYPLTVSIGNPTEIRGNYDITCVAGAVTIAPRPLTLRKTADASFRVSKIYDGTAATDFPFAYRTHYFLDGADVGAEISDAAIANAVYDSPDVASASKIIVTFGALQTGNGYLAGNYVYAEGGTLEFAAEIVKKEVAVAWGNTQFVYNGEVQTPAASATGLSGALTVSVSGGETNAGSYRATAAPTDGNYRLTNDGVGFTIAPATVSASWGELRFVYDGETKRPAVSAVGVKGEAVALNMKITMNGIEIAGAIGAGKYRAAVSSGDPNYTVDAASAEREFGVSPAEVAVAWGAASFGYDGDAHRPAASASGTKRESVALTIRVTKNGAEIAAAVDAGTYRAKASSANPNYIVASATAEQEFTIAPMAISAVWSELPAVYNGTYQRPNASAIGAKGVSIPLTVSVAGQTEGAKNAGSHTATASLSDANYVLNADTVARSFTIAPASVSVVWSGLAVEYDGSEKRPTAKIATFEGEKTLTVSVTKDGAAATAVDAGGYRATAAYDDANYALTNAEVSFTIAKKKVAAVWSAGGGVYDGQPRAPGIVFENTPYAGDFENPVVKYYGAGGAELAADAVVPVGSYRAELLSYDSKNYELTGTSIEFTISEPVAPEPGGEAL